MPDMEAQATSNKQMGQPQRKVAKLSSNDIETKQYQQEMRQQLSDHEDRIQSLEKEGQDGTPQKKRAKMK